MFLNCWSKGHRYWEQGRYWGLLALLLGATLLGEKGHRC